MNSDSTESAESDERDVGEVVIGAMAGEVGKAGDDKKLHFLASLALVYAGGGGETTVHDLFNCQCDSLEVGIEKELNDIGANQQTHDDLKQLICDLRISLASIADFVADHRLDKGDLAADLIGLHQGIALLGVRKLVCGVLELPPRKQKNSSHEIT